MTNRRVTGIPPHLPSVTNKILPFQMGDVGRRPIFTQMSKNDSGKRSVEVTAASAPLNTIVFHCFLHRSCDAGSHPCRLRPLFVWYLNFLVPNHCCCPPVPLTIRTDRHAYIYICASVSHTELPRSYPG